jgi:hypothetical protein
MSSLSEEDLHLEEEVQMSFEEITRKEGQLKNLLEVTNFLFRKTEESSVKFIKE